MIRANIFISLLCYTSTLAAQDLYAQPPVVGRAVRTVHTACRVPAACSSHVRPSASQRLHLPVRVVRQFSGLQTVVVQHAAMSQSLHK
jgi:hypothetical protein